MAAKAGLGIANAVLRQTGAPFNARQAVSAVSNVAKVARKLSRRKSKDKSDSTIMVSPCCLKLAAAISDPFSDLAKDCCLAIPPVVKSQKLRCFIRGEASIGDANFGFIAVNPSIANDSVSVWYTNSAYSQTDVQFLSATNTLLAGVSTANINTPYTGTQFSSGNASTSSASKLRGRVVSCGISAEYVGTDLNKSGLMYCCAPSLHENMSYDVGQNSNPNTANLGARNNCEISHNDRMKCRLSVFPTTADEQAYNDTTG
jgi:hypothetical protein